MAPRHYHNVGHRKSRKFTCFVHFIDLKLCYWFLKVAVLGNRHCYVPLNLSLRRCSFLSIQSRSLGISRLRFPMFLLSSTELERGSPAPSIGRLLFCPPSLAAAVRFPLIVGSLNDYPVIDDISNLFRVLSAISLIAPKVGRALSVSVA